MSIDSPPFGCSAPASEWRLLLPALLMAASATAAHAWLGYTPPELQASADAALARLQRGAAIPFSPLPLHSIPSCGGFAPWWHVQA